MLRKFIKLSTRIKGAYEPWSVDSRIESLNDWFDERTPNAASDDEYDHTKTVNNYYDLCHEFMEYGWGDSLHFAPLKPNETLEDAVVRHQRLMIDKLALHEGLTVVDVGCGVGGPMRRVVSEAGVKVVGINNNGYQLSQARTKNVDAGLDHMTDYMKCNFMDMSGIEANTFDAGYAIESTCHAPHKERAYAEIFRILKPGALLWGQEMCLTDAYESGNPRHTTIKDELMRGIALNEIASFDEVNRTLEAVGFDVVEAADLDVKEGPSTPWYYPLESRYGSLGNYFRRTPLGRTLISWVVRLAESARLFPRGSYQVIEFMDRTADAYVSGGKEGIFTPLYCFVARKPSL